MKLRIAACLILLSLPTLARAQDTLQTKLFTSAEQRQYLDYIRKDFLSRNKQTGFDIQESQVPEIPTNVLNSPNASTEPVIYSLGGIIKRSDGHLTIWLNNQQLNEQQLPKRITLVQDGRSYALRVTLENGRKQLLRTGQAVDLTTGQLLERYQRQTPEPATPPAASTDDKRPASSNVSAAVSPEKPSANTADKAPENLATATNTPTKPEAESEPGKATLGALLDEARNNPKALDTMIQSLQKLRDTNNAQTSP